MELTGKTILITGSNRGIGRAIAEEFSNYPVHLLLGVRDPTPPVFGLENPNPKCLSVEVVRIDLTDFDSIEKSCDELGDRIQNIDILVNNAGSIALHLLEEQESREMYHVMQVNLIGLIHLTQRILPWMLRKKSGKIVNNASIAGMIHFPATNIYSASKAGVIAFTHSIRRELKDTGVDTLLLITPGVKTRMYEETKKVYSKHLSIKELEYVKAEDWARSIRRAVQSDRKILYPGGKTYFAGWLNQHFPRLFDLATAAVFKREGRRL